MKKNTAVLHATPRHATPRHATPRHATPSRSHVASSGKFHFAHILKPSYRSLLFLLAAGIFLFSCEDKDEIKPSSEATMTTLTLTVESKDYEITFKDRQGTITLPYATKLPVTAKVAAVTLSAKATGVKVGDDVTISASESFTLTITAEDKTTTQEYTVTVKKAAASSDASITSLTLTVGSTDHEIDFTDRAYTLILSAGSTPPTEVGVKEIELSLGATSDAGTKLNVTNNTVTITVTAEDKKTTQEYTVTLSMAASVGASITTLTLTVGSADYDIMFQGTQGTVVVPYDTEIPAQVVVKEIALSDGATSVDQGTQLSVTDNAVTITVTAEGGETKSAYTVTFSVAANSEASITTLILTVEDKDYEIMFTDMQGTMKLPYGTAIPTQVEVKEIALSDGATSNTSNGNELTVTNNTITITVTAEDGETTQEYTVTVENAGSLSSEAAITSLTLTVGDTDYEITFTGMRDTLRVGPLGTPVPAEVGVKEIALSVGAKGVADDDELTVTNNAVTLTVTAENGTTTNTYTVVLAFTTAGITSFMFEVADNESMALDEADRQQIVGMIDHQAATITFDEQSAYVYRDKLKATFEVSEAGASVQVAGATQESGTTEQDFSAPVSYEVSAEGTETTTYTVTLLKSTMATIPDAQFRAKLKELVPTAFTGDELDITHTTVINNKGTLDVSDQTPKLTSLKGVEFFTALTQLFCIGNSLPSLDVRKNTALKDLICNENSLTSLDVSANTALKDLRCQINSLQSLDVSANTALETLYCDDNGLMSLDVRENTSLKDLRCNNNSLTSLDVSANTSLTTLRCVSNDLTSLNVSGITALWELACNNNALKSLDVSGITALNRLKCNNNKITSLDVSGNTSLAILNCSSNSLTSLNISGITSLTTLNCGSNSLPSLNVSGHTSLTNLSCDNNKFTLLNVDNNTALTALDCGYNSLTSLDVRKNTSLTDLYCHNNALTSLDVRVNTSLTFLLCSGNRLTSLDMTGMRSVTALNIGTGTGTDSQPDNHLLATLRVNTALQDRREIVTMKTARKANLTITTVNNDGGVVCNDYAPAETGGNCN